MIICGIALSKHQLLLLTLKDNSLEINSLSLNNCFSYRNVFQNGVNALSKMGLKNNFLSKSSKVQILLAFGTNIFLRNVRRDFKIPMSALAT